MSYYVVPYANKWRVRETCFLFSWWATFGDGCGNGTGKPVEYDTKEECEQWIKLTQRC